MQATYDLPNGETVIIPYIREISPLTLYEGDENIYNNQTDLIFNQRWSIFSGLIGFIITFMDGSKKKIFSSYIDFTMESSQKEAAYEHMKQKRDELIEGINHYYFRKQ